jgi:flagellar secretion chaperone FliS
MTYQRPRDSYFETQVLTATPQKLRLMLIDGALTFARRAAEHWRQGRMYEGGESIIGCQRIVTELLHGLKAEMAPELVGNVGSLYNFVFRALIEAGLKHDATKLNDAVTVLEIERETWRQVCEQLGSSLEATPAAAATPSPHFGRAQAEITSSGGFSIDA